MCGRYTLRKPVSEETLSEEIGLPVVLAPDVNTQEPRYNIAPTQQNLALRSRGEANALELCQMRWGLIPSWSKRPQTRSPLINARCETAAEKPAFRAAFQRRRCLVPADGFYEWKKSRSVSTPFFFHLKEHALFFMAGLWESWYGEVGEKVESYTILTTQSNALMSKYHDRMPVILRGDRAASWLATDSSTHSAAERLDLFTPLDPSEMECQPASPAVNNNRTEGPACLEAPANQPVSQLDLGL